MGLRSPEIGGGGATTTTVVGLEQVVEEEPRTDDVRGSALGCCFSGLHVYRGLQVETSLPSGVNKFFLHTTHGRRLRVSQHGNLT
jgi:hypothetical protein